MTGTERRDAILNRIKNSKTPVAGRTLAEACDVSRQVIVQDIALIRASGYDIISTNRGYILSEPSTVSRTFKVRHTDAQLEEELNSLKKTADFFKKTTAILPQITIIILLMQTVKKRWI